MKIAFESFDQPLTGAIVLGLAKDAALAGASTRVDDAVGGALGRAIKARKFAGKQGQTLTLTAPSAALSRVVLIGLGDLADFDDAAAEAVGGEAVAALAGEASGRILIDAPDAVAARIGFGAQLRRYRFDKYKSKTPDGEDEPAQLDALTIAATAPDAAQAAFAPLSAVADGVAFARDLQNEPANILYPESFAERAAALTADGLEVEVLDEAAMTKLGMGALLGVGQGSVRESRLVVMRWNGGAEGEAPLCFVGKGVCFDTGGISIKPAAGMEDMKWDMGGAGVVCGLMKALAGRKAKANVVGIVGLVENMPDGNAQRPGDIVTSMSGKTIEVLNTDAEGRLVLADALWYAQDRFKPKFMIDLATLTGAIIVALGEEYAGLFSNDDGIADALVAAGAKSSEKPWRMPLHASYDREIEGDWGDVKNIGAGRWGGAITAAQFLQRFVNDVPWAHLDIAGVTWTKKDKATTPKGATGFGVRLLDRFVAEGYES